MEQTYTMKFSKGIKVLLIILAICSLSYTQIRYRFLKNDKSLDNSQLVNEVEWLDRTVSTIYNDYVTGSSATATYASMSNSSIQLTPRSLPTGKTTGTIHAQSDGGIATLYIATETTVGSQSWVKVGSQ